MVDKTTLELIEIWKATDAECRGHSDYEKKMELRLTERFEDAMQRWLP